MPGGPGESGGLRGETFPKPFRDIKRVAPNLLHLAPPTNEMQCSAELCNEFPKHFTDKINSIHRQLDSRLSSYSGFPLPVLSNAVTISTWLWGRGKGGVCRGTLMCREGLRVCHGSLWKGSVLCKPSGGVSPSSAAWCALSVVQKLMVYPGSSAPCRCGRS